jgi:UDP-N-acetylmuramoylalanine-D-glutamate ligase
VVVKTPGLSRYRPEVARPSGLDIPVVGGQGLWLADADLRRVLCVTGGHAGTSRSVMLPTYAQLAECNETAGEGLIAEGGGACMYD